MNLLSGFRAWFWQRLSALYLALFFLYALASLALSPPQGFEAWRAWWSHPLRQVFLLLFALLLLIHAWVGVRDVILDYVRPLPLKAFLLALLGLALFGEGVWFLRIIGGL